VDKMPGNRKEGFIPIQRCYPDEYLEYRVSSEYWENGFLPVQMFRIRFEDRYVNYETTLLEELEPAYAITVHKSQGSEYPIVILPMGNIPPMLRSRNLLYTAVTRAQMMVILVGRDAVCLSMVKNNRQAKRYTGLSHWLRGGMG
jgi:ATP-dependent exoDNAse (exonuclease V) alpha subunit